MVMLGIVKRLMDLKLCGDGRKAPRLQFILKVKEARLSQVKMLRGFCINAGSVLRTQIIALTHALGRVVTFPKLSQERVKCYSTRVPNH